MKIVFDSRSGHGRKFAKKLPFPQQSVSKSIDTPCILVTRNVGLGKIPDTTKQFLKKYGACVKGVVVNGNKKYGKYFCAAGPKIEKKFSLPVIRNIEGEGTEKDVLAVLSYIQALPHERAPLTVVFDSRTGLGKQFAKKLSLPRQSVSKPIGSPCILVTRNAGLGKIPDTTKQFLKKYGAYVKGVVINGNRDYGEYFCAAGSKIEKKFDIPVIRNIEGAGTPEDVDAVLTYVRTLE